MDSEVKSLVELSLNNIKEHFGRHTYAYIFSEDKIIEKNLRFLQRFYSDDLLSSVSKERHLREDTDLYFLLNKHLRKIDILSLLRCTYKEKIVEKLIPIANSICEMSLCSTAYTNYKRKFAIHKFFEKAKYILRNVIPYMTNIKKIVLPHICDEYMLKLIGSACSNLIELDIKDFRSIHVHDKDFVFINRKLPISAEISEMANLMKNAPYLEEIKCWNLPAAIELLFEREGQTILSEKRFLNLTVLDLTSCNAESQVLAICSEISPKVRTLAVNILNDEQLRLLCRFSYLENLFLNRNTRIQSRSDLNICNYFDRRRVKLKYLAIFKFSLSVSTLIKVCPNLETLQLVNNRYEKLDKNSDDCFLNHLRYLQFSRQYLRHPFCVYSLLKVLESYSKLEILTFYLCFFNESDFEDKFAKSPLKYNLKQLNFFNCDITVGLLLNFISNCESLDVVTLHHCPNLSNAEISTVKETIRLSNMTTEINFVFSTMDIYVLPLLQHMYDLSNYNLFIDIDKYPRPIAW